MDTLDADGKLRDADYRRRHRHLRFTQRPDGSAYGSFELEADAAEVLLTILDTLAAPKPAADGTKDPRTAEQRNHNGGPPANEGVAGGGGFHHREFERLGWRCVMINGIPHLIPPKWLDREQKPRRNYAHNPIDAI